MVINPGEHVMTLMKRIFLNGWQSVLGFASSLCTLLMPAVPTILVAVTFILVDMIYGYKVSRKYGHREIESNKLWKTINKITEAGLLIIMGLFLDKYIFMTYESLTAVRVVAGAICVAESLSLLESLRALHPNAILSKLLSKIVKSKAEKYLDVDLTDIITDTNDVSINELNKEKNSNNSK